MTKRLIDLDDELLADAQRELNTTGVSDTVRTALKQATARSALEPAPTRAPHDRRTALSDDRLHLLRRPHPRQPNWRN